MGDDFDVEDNSMLNYAEDLDIAPLDLMIVVCAAMLLALGLQPTNGAPSHVYLTSDVPWRRAHLIRTTVASPGSLLVQTSASSPTSIILGSMFPFCI
jgi:hypothetical protein